MLPHFVWQDFDDVIAELRAVRLRRSTPTWFAPHFEFRFPLLGDVAAMRRRAVELRKRSSPGTCWARRARPAARRATSIRRWSACRCKVTGLTASRHVVTCNGRALPLQPTGNGRRVRRGVRYRAWQPAAALHPTIGVHAPLRSTSSTPG